MNALALTALVCALFVVVWAIARVGTIIWDGLSDMSEHAWHPAKLAARGIAVALGAAVLVVLAIIFRLILLTIKQGIVG